MCLTIDALGCIGCGLCAELLPGIVRMGSHVAELRGDGALGEEALQAAREAAEDCPAAALGFSEVSCERS